MSPAPLFTHTDKKSRCFWCAADPLYIAYHDNEWGRPVTDDQSLFEKICLEGFQAGLSWLTILRKRDHFRAAFHDFEISRVARFSARDVDRLLRNPGIVRHKGKILSAINNARRALELQKSFGSLAAYFWQFQPPSSSRPRTLDWHTLKSLTKSEHSIALSKDLKKYGFSFVGPTTMYAFMQAMGIVNDHLSGCCIRAPLEKQRRNFTPPAPLPPALASHNP